MPNAFPGWAASAATSLTYLTGWDESTIPWIVTILLLSIGLATTVSPVVYNTRVHIPRIVSPITGEEEARPPGTRSR